MSTTPKAGFTFSRKIQVRPYETADASIFIEIDTDGTNDELIQRLRDAASQAKALVFEELGIQFSVEANGFVRESIEAHFGAVTEVAAAPMPSGNVAPTPRPAAPTPQAAPVATSDGTPPFPTDTFDKAQKKANQDWAKARYNLNPGEFFDNREKKASGAYKPTAPDVKHKDTGIGVWFD